MWIDLEKFIGIGVENIEAVDPDTSGKIWVPSYGPIILHMDR